MDASLLLARIAEALQRHKLEAVLIGNAAAAVHGAPVTTIDLDFMFRNTRSNRQKLIHVARDLGAVLYVPYGSKRDEFRIEDNDYSLLLVFRPSSGSLETL